MRGIARIPARNEALRGPLILSSSEGIESLEHSKNAGGQDIYIDATRGIVIPSLPLNLARVFERE